MKSSHTTVQAAKKRNPLMRLLFISLIVVLLSLYVVNASIPGTKVEGCPQDCGFATPRREGPVRVVTLNMLHGFPTFKNLSLRVDLIAGEIKRLDADVVLLQEVPWTTMTGNVAEVLGKQLGYNYVFYRANGNKRLIFFEEGEAILSRFPLKDVVAEKLVPNAGAFQNRTAVGATAITPWGEVRLYSAHLTHSSDEANAQQVQEFRGFVEANTAGMAIVGGDFNARDNSPQIQALDAAWTDTYRTMHPSDKGYTCCTSDLNAAPVVYMQMRIDYIFLVNSRWKLVSAEHAFYTPFKTTSGWQWASDHTGLIVEIQPEMISRNTKASFR